MKDGVELHAKIQETGSPIWLIHTHGIGEHLDRHQYLTDLFGKDFNIFQYDLRGHGRSLGPSAYVEETAGLPTNDTRDHHPRIYDKISFRMETCKSHPF